MQALCIILQLALLTGSGQDSAASDGRTIPVVELTSRVNEVIVSASGATLTRLVDVELDEGLTRLHVILNDESTTNTEGALEEVFSIVASGADILSHSVQKSTEPADQIELEALQVDLRRLSEKIDAANERILGATADIDLLESVARTIAETRVELDSESLLELIESINVRRRTIIEDLARQERVFDESHSEKQRLIEELTAREKGMPRVACEIVTRSPGGPARFTITRRAPTTKWLSEIEMDWNSQAASARTRVLGRVTNRSGVDWNDVRLVLDTGYREPTRLLPPLEESVIDPVEDQPESTEPTSDALKLEASRSKPSRQRERMFTVELPISLDQGNTGLVLLESFETTFTTSLIARPISSPGVHLVGAARNTSEGIIPAGRLRVHKDGRAFTRSMLPMIEEQNDYQVPLGVEDGILISRRLVSREEIRTGLLNGGKLTTLTYRITVRNLNDVACLIRIEDRIPVPGSEDIEVALKSSAPQPIVTPGFDGTLQWLLEIPAGGPDSIPVAIDWEVTVAHSADLEINDFIE